MKDHMFTPRQVATGICTLALFFGLMISKAFGQPPVPPKQGAGLHTEIEAMDSLLTLAYNNHDIKALSALFSEDLEFYHDKDGRIDFKKMSAGFQHIFERGDGITRTLVKGSLEIYPMGADGAIQVGAHRFCHLENGTPDCGTFRFVHIWQKKAGGWKIVRVVSYGH
jgi:ketosteroid isomerase-like protein